MSNWELPPQSKLVYLMSILISPFCTYGSLCAKTLERLGLHGSFFSILLSLRTYVLVPLKTGLKNIWKLEWGSLSRPWAPTISYNALVEGSRPAWAEAAKMFYPKLQRTNQFPGTPVGYGCVRHEGTPFDSITCHAINQRRVLKQLS